MAKIANAINTFQKYLKSTNFKTFSIQNLPINNNIKLPEDGFEPPLEEPESSVLPLDDSGIQNKEYTKYAVVVKCFILS